MEGVEIKQTKIRIIYIMTTLIASQAPKILACHGAPELPAACLVT